MNTPPKRYFVHVRLKSSTKVVEADGRLLSHHGRFGNLHLVSAPEAVRLIDAGLAKLLRHLDLERLRRHVAEGRAA
jgi:hypothetical protein